MDKLTKIESAAGQNVQLGGVGNEKLIQGGVVSNPSSVVNFQIGEFKIPSPSSAVTLHK